MLLDEPTADSLYKESYRELKEKEQDRSHEYCFCDSSRWRFLNWEWIVINYLGAVWEVVNVYMVLYVLCLLMLKING